MIITGNAVSTTSQQAALALNVLAQVLLSKPFQRMLQIIADNPGSELAAGLDLHVEQRFDA